MSGEGPHDRRRADDVTRAERVRLIQVAWRDAAHGFDRVADTMTPGTQLSVTSDAVYDLARKLHVVADAIKDMNALIFGGY